MKNVATFLFSLGCLCVFFILQHNHILSVYGINPNIILVVLFVFVFARLPIWMFSLISFVFVLIVWQMASFWLTEIIVLILTTLFISAIKGIFTGRKIIDFLISIILGTTIFYTFLYVFEYMQIHGISFSKFAFSIPNYFVLELIYNLILGCIAWFLFLRGRKI